MASITSHKKEVNIVGKIEPCDIVRYYDRNGVCHENPGYVADRALERSTGFPERLNALFPAPAA